MYQFFSWGPIKIFLRIRFLRIRVIRILIFAPKLLTLEDENNQSTINVVNQRLKQIIYQRLTI